MKKLSFEEALRKINEVNKNRYELIEFKEYNGKKMKLKFYCHEKDKFGREHGLFTITFENFVNGKRNCPKCSRRYVPSYEEALETILLANNNRYKLIEFKEYNGSYSPITFYCNEKDEDGNEHGIFKTSFYSFVNLGCKCPKCSGIYRPTLEEALEKVKKINNGKYDIIGFEKGYKNKNSKIKFYCHEKDENGKEHGEFIMSYTNFVNYKCKCAKCTKHYTPSYEEALKNIVKVNNGMYELIEFNYTENKKSKITFCCHKKDKFEIEHGKFTIPYVKFVNVKQGCPICKSSHLEREVNFFLTESNIQFKFEQKFDWLKFEINQSIDFFIDSLNIGIECQGLQHFKPINFFKGEEFFKKTVERDINKYNLCKENGIKLIYLLPKEKVDFSYINSIQEIYREDNTFKTTKDLIVYLKQYL